jgi:hypothetical protein
MNIIFILSLASISGFIISIIIAIIWMTNLSKRKGNKLRCGGAL